MVKCRDERCAVQPTNIPSHVVKNMAAAKMLLMKGEGFTVEHLMTS